MKVQAGTTMVLVEFDQTLGLYKPILRVEIPRSKFTLDNAVRKIIELNESCDIDYVYVDKGFGEYQLETLHRYGMDHPHTGLHEKVKGVSFWETIYVPDPFTRKYNKKRFKHWMINQLQILFERNRIILPPEDRHMARQFFNYRVKGRTATGEPIFTDEDEHIIDAVGLAVHGLLTHFSEICKVRVGHSIAVVSNVIAKRDKQFQPRRRAKMGVIRGGGVRRRTFNSCPARAYF